MLLSTVSSFLQHISTIRLYSAIQAGCSEKDIIVTVPYMLHTGRPIRPVTVKLLLQVFMMMCVCVWSCSPLMVDNTAGFTEPLVANYNNSHCDDEPVLDDINTHTRSRRAVSHRPCHNCQQLHCDEGWSRWWCVDWPEECLLNSVGRKTSSQSQHQTPLFWLGPGVGFGLHLSGLHLDLSILLFCFVAYGPSCDR